MSFKDMGYITGDIVNIHLKHRVSHNINIRISENGKIIPINNINLNNITALDLLSILEKKGDISNHDICEFIFKSDVIPSNTTLVNFGLKDNDEIILTQNKTKIDIYESRLKK